MRVMREGDFVAIHLSHAVSGTWVVEGHVKHRNDTEAVIDVDYPGEYETITVGEFEPWDEDLTALRDRTSVRIGSVDTINLIKIPNTQISNQTPTNQVADD